MGSLGIALVAFGCVFGGALIGIAIRPRLNENHLGTETKEFVKVGVGLIATMTALVLGLLVASAKGSFDTQRAEVAQMSADIVLLDRTLAHYGPEAQKSRDFLRAMVGRVIERMWPEHGTAEAKPKSNNEELFDQIQQLAPKTDTQRTLQAQATRLVVDLGEKRWLLYAQHTSAISMPLLSIVVFWLTITFGSFGLFAPRNGVVFVTLFVCSVSIAAAIFLVLELDRPFEGMIRISSEPMRNALAQLGH
jgi:hypothetical protein